MRRLTVLMPGLAVVLALLLALPATGAPPTERIVRDAHERRSAYDIRTVTLSSAAPGHPRALVVVEYDRAVQVGDEVDFWINTDADHAPDLFVTGASFSDYAVYRARSWTRHHHEITDLGCAQLRMRGVRSILRFDPDCLEPSTRFSVSVRAIVRDSPENTADYAPGAERFSGSVLAHSAS